MQTIVQAKRVLELPPYIFSEINTIKEEATKRGAQLLSLGIGDPDLPTPDGIIEKLKEAIQKKENHGYSPYEGTFQFRSAVSGWFQSRFNVSLDPKTEVLALIGSKEGIAHFPVAFCNPGDKCFYPDPGYPVFSTSISLAGGIPVPVPHRSGKNFLPDTAELEKLFIEHHPKYMILNFPCNPTSATCDRATLTEIVNLALKHQVILVSDNAYSEMYYDKKDRPLSILEIPGAKDIALEFHSFSKTFNMTGWRIAFAVGNEKLVAGLLRVKTNIDSGPLLAVQEAACFAMEHADKFSEPIRQVYRERKEILLTGLRLSGIEFYDPKATFFIWAKVPGVESSMDFTKRLIKEQSLVVTPGIGFGQYGEGFFRLSMTVPNDSLRDAVLRLSKR